MFNQFGIEGVDNFEMYVSIMHFKQASQLLYTGNPNSGQVFEIYEPKAGDVIKSEYNDMFYEIIEVKETEEQFLGTQHTYTFIVRKYQDNHISISADTSATMLDLDEVTDQVDILEINDVIDTENEENNNVDWW
jgi:hypothetical protein